MKYDSGFKADKIVQRILKLTSVKAASLPSVLSAKWTSPSKLQRFQRELMGCGQWERARRDV